MALDPYIRNTKLNDKKIKNLNIRHGSPNVEEVTMDKTGKKKCSRFQMLDNGSRWEGLGDD